MLGALIALVVILSCKKELSSEEQSKTQEINKIAEWYRAKIKISDENVFSKLQPNWDNVYSNELSNLIVYEVELNNTQKLMIINGERRNRDLDTEAKKQQMKLLIFEDRKTKKIMYASYMSVENLGFVGANELHYKNFDKLTGTVYYYHFSGRFANGWAYEDGRVISSLAATTKQQYENYSNSRNTERQTQGTSCWYGYAEKYQFQCVGVPGHDNCGYNFVGYEYVSYCATTQDEWYPGQQENEDPFGGYVPAVFYDCDNVMNGSAYWSTECNTCIGGTTGLTACPKEIKDSLLNKCMKNAKDIIITQNGSVNALLRNFTDDSSFSPNYTWILKNGTTSENELAITGSWDRFNRNVTTSIDDTKFTNASDLAIVKTLLHEGIHAYLVAYFANDPLNANKEYAVLFNNYVSAKRPDLNEIHHNEMARIFVDQIAISLEEYGNSKGYVFSSSIAKQQFYGDLAWGGLFESKAFKAMSSDEQERIKTVISIEQKGENLLGQSKTAKGKVGGCL